MATGGIGAPIGSPIGGVINAATGNQDAAGVAIIGVVVSGVGESIADAVGNAVIDFNGSAVAQVGDTVGDAALDISADGIASSLSDSVGAANIDFDAQAVGEGLGGGDGIGDSNFDFIVSGVSSFSRQPIRVIIGMENARRATTRIGALASRTRNSVPRSNTEITNG